MGGGQVMDAHKVVSAAEWDAARKQLLAKEKEFTRLRDELSRQRRELPWERVEKSYVFDGPDGQQTLAQLFAGRHQLVVFHFMFTPSWDEGCKSCSFWADNLDGVVVHLNHRDVSFAAVSRAPHSKLAAYQKRMGWHFPWVSSAGNSFNFDYRVSFPAEELTKGEITYNYRAQKTTMEDLPGFSVFYRDDGGTIFHTYSCYARGLDMLNGAYHLLDLVPKGRDEDALSYSMEWLRRHDQYAPGK
jgi:predicted dithiol-disulfide oxidoreductase (DUF899 family)